jgi:hypothetical protein
MRSPLPWGLAARGQMISYHIAEALFWIFAVGATLLPQRWAILSLLLLSNVDVVAPGSSSIRAVGWDNAAKTVVIPALLLLRITHFRRFRIKRTLAVRAWMALVLYAALSTLWSPFKLSAMKMVAYLACYIILYLIFSVAWRRQIIDGKVIAIGVLGSLALACVATYGLGDPYGTTDARFTSFTSPQTFSFYLFCLLAILLFSPGKDRLRWGSIAGCIVGIVLAGSRFTFLGVAFLFVCVWLRRELGMNGALGTSKMLKAAAAAALCMIGLVFLIAWAVPGNRLMQLIDLGVSRTSGLEDIGTVAWRLRMYRDAALTLSQRSALTLSFGSGTSSAGELAFRYFRNWPAMSRDPNRTLHDEFIRLAYEWGLVGLILGGVLLTCLVRHSWRVAIRRHSPRGFAALGIVPGILMGLLVENVLAASSSGMGVGVVLAITYGLSAVSTPKEQTPVPCR